MTSRFGVIALAMILPALASCTSAAERQQAVVMDAIEGTVYLPAGAFTLDRYARYYATDGNRVVATYLSPGDARLTYQSGSGAGWLMATTCRCRWMAAARSC